MPNDLHLADDFPPVSTAEWEAAIARDLKGADYEKRLVWKTEEGIAVRPYYRRGDVQPQDLNLPREPWQEAQGWTPPADAIRADYFHEAGATAVQELGFAFAQALETRPAQPVFVFSVGSNYFFEIAKLRAVRLLWASLGNGEALRIHVRTARANKSLYDRYTNLLRVTTEALSAVIGGCDSLDVEPFGFAPELALNVQRILREEAYARQVPDAAAGSYYVESITASMAHEASSLVEQIRKEGGWASVVESGFLDRSLTASREAKAKAMASRKRTLVGVNNYPNLKEKISDVAPPTPLPGDPLPQARLAEPFERIRQRTAAYAQRTGRFPVVLLLKRGDGKMKGARAMFCLNFFGCAGFDIVESEEFAGAGADLIVLCSSDPEYLAFAREVCPVVNVPVLVAGNPKEQIAELQSAGVQGFVHVSSNSVDTLTEWQDKLGIA